MSKADGEQTEIEQLETYVEWIEDGDFGSPWMEKIGKLVEKYPGYKPRLDEAISKGETKTIERFMRWIEKGDFEWIKAAGELAAKHPEYKPRIEVATSVGRRVSGKETVMAGKNGYLDASSFIPVPAELSRLPEDYASKIKSHIDQFNGLRKQLAETNDWKSTGKPAYNSLLGLFDYSKYRNGGNPEKEMEFLDDVPELQAPLAIGLDRLTMGLTSARAKGTICETRYNYWLDKTGSMKNRILDYKPKESVWRNKT